MNIKKGLLRLWLVSLPIVFGWSYFSEVNKANPVMMTWYGFHQDAIRESEKPVCQEIINKNPNEYPKTTSPNSCPQLSVFWDSLKASKNSNQKINKEDIDALFEKNWASYPSKQGLIYGSIALVAYQLILVILAVLFFIAKWVYRGFKSEKNPAN
jgi:hypothetical protein